MESKKYSDFFYGIFLALQLGFIIVIPLAGFVLFGAYLDRRLNTHPFLLILSVVLCFVILFFEIRNLLLPFLKKHK